MTSEQSQADECAIGADAAQVLRVAYVLAYRAPHYIRTESMLEALSACPNVELSIARNKRTGISRYLETWRLLRELRETINPDIYVLGFRGHEFFWPLRWLIAGKPLVFDALMSPFAALRDEHKNSPIHRVLAWLIYPFERSALRHADLVLTDTKLHVDFFTKAFGLPAAKFSVVPVGAAGHSANSNQCIQKDEESFHVLFYGSFLPLHGIDIILEAATQLTDLPICFDFVGGTAAHGRQLRRFFKARGAVTYSHRHWVPFEALLSHDLASSDLVLGGPFGGTPQARRVVTGKAIQALALGKPTVIGHIAEDHGFVDQENCLLVQQADSIALARTIRWAFNHRDMLSAIGDRGTKVYAERFSTRAIAARLAPTLQSLVDRVRE